MSSATESKMREEDVEMDSPMSPTEEREPEMDESQDIPMTEEERESQSLELKQEGNQKYSKGEYRAAISLYSRAIELCGENHPEYYGNRAAAYLGCNDFPKALTDCKKAISLNPDYVKAYLRGVESLTQLGRFDEAIRMANDGQTRFPAKSADFARSLSTLSQLERRLQRFREYMSDGSFTRALNIIRTMIDQEVRHSVVLRCDMIECLLEAAASGRDMTLLQEALSCSTNTMRQFGDTDARLLKLRSICLFRTSSVDSAVKHVQRILNRDPDNREIKALFKMFKNSTRLKKQGNDAFKSGDFEAAYAKYSQCLELDEGKNFVYNSILFCNRAAVSMKKGDFQSACDDCSNAIECDGSYWKGYIRRSDALIGLKRFEEAVADCERAKEMVSDRNQAREVEQKLRKAKVELKKSLRKNYYEILGVSEDATENDLKKAFRKNAMKWHPDRFASASEEEQKGAEEKFKEIGEAYEVLKDPETRRKYDMGYDLNEIKQGAGGFGGGFGPGGGVDMADILRMFNGMGGMPGGMGGHHHHSHGGMGGGPGFTFRFG